MESGVFKKALNRWFLKNAETAKIITLALLVLLCIGAVYHSHFIRGHVAIFTHFLYLPAALAGFWWGRRGAWVAVSLGAMLMIACLLSGQRVPLMHDAFRAMMLVAIGLAVGFLRERALQSERSLRETRDYLNSLIHCANAPIIVWNPEGKITLFNDAFQRLTGYQAEEMMGKPLTTIFNGATREESWQKIEQTLKGRRWEAVEIPVTCKDGTERILLWNSANIYAPDGKTLIATIAQGQDITLRKEAEEALNLRVSELEAHEQIIESMLERRIKELAVHERIVGSMLRALDLDERLEIGLKEIMNLMGIEKAGISLVEGDRLVMRKQFGFSGDYLAWASDLPIEDVPSCEEVTVGWNNLPDFSSRLETALKKEKVKRWVTVPLKSERGFLGILILASENPRSLPEEQIEILSVLAGTLTLMMEQARLYRTAQERLARLTTLREIDRAISANLSMEGIIEVVLRKLSPHIWVDAVGISLIDWERKQTMLARLHLPGDVSIEGEAFNLSDSLLAQLGVEKRPVIIYDVKSDPRLQNHRDIVRKYNLSSYVGVPLVVQDRAIGVLHLFTVEPRQFSQEDLDFFTTMAGQAAISVQNARLYEEARQRAANMEGLAKATLIFPQISREEEMAQQILTSACDITGAEIGGLFWYDKDTNTLELAAEVGVLKKEIGWVREMYRTPVGPEARLPGLVAFTGQSVYVPDVSKEPLWDIKFLRTGSAYLVPLIHREHLFGVYVFLSRHVDGFSAEQRALADAFAGYVSSALENVRLFRETQRAYEELKATQEQFLQAQKMEAIGRLAGGVAHDFNNLLTTIQGYAELGLMKLKEGDPAYRELRAVHRASLRAADLTRQLLLFSRKQPTKMTPLDLNASIKETVKMLTHLVGEDVSIKTELAEGLWTVNADPGNIEQVIMNLSVNARDAMPEGGELLLSTGNVYIDEEYSKTHAEAKPGKFVCLSVKDTGIGMDEETLKHIFEPFFTTKEPGIGTGLGLSVVYGIVKQHNGWIDVESSPGRGTTFRIYFPAVFTKPVEEQKVVIPLEAYRGKGERILLVEDEKSLQEFAVEGLSEHGYVVFAATNAREALDIFTREEGNFDLIFSDVVLPDQKGPQLVNQLLKIKPGIQAVFASGYSDEKSSWQAIQESGYPYLQKPYSLSDLLKVVRDSLRK